MGVQVAVHVAALLNATWHNHPSRRLGPRPKWLPDDEAGKEWSFFFLYC